MAGWDSHARDLYRFACDKPCHARFIRIKFIFKGGMELA